MIPEAGGLKTGQFSLPTPRCFGGRVTLAQNRAHGRQQARNAGLGQVLGPSDPLPPWSCVGETREGGEKPNIRMFVWQFRKDG